MQEEIHMRIRRTAEMIALSAGAAADVRFQRGNPITYNDPKLTERMVPTLKRIAGDALSISQPTTTSEDVSLYQQQIPGLFFFLGITPKDSDPAKVAANHSPRFFADEGALIIGIRALGYLAVDYLRQTR
jgi:amidohydrolase